MKKLTIFLTALLPIFNCCKKTYINNFETQIDTVFQNGASTSLIYDTIYPITINFNSNKIIAAPNIIGNETINLSFNDSVVGSTISILTFINSGGSVNLNYNTKNTIVSLTSGSFTNPIPGTNLIVFIYLGNINNLNMISASITLQP